MLRQIFLLATKKPIIALPFPIMVPNKFMEKLRDRDPMTLVIPANYGFVLYYLRGYI